MKRKLFIFLSINAFFIIYFFRFLFPKTDMESYVGAARFLYNLPGGFDDGTCQLVKIFPLILPGLLEKTLTINAAYGFTVQNLIFYFLAAYLILEIAFYLFNNKKTAFFAAVIYSTASPLLSHSLGFQTDMPGWFFGILGIWLILTKFKSINKPAISVFIGGVIMGLGILNKESAIIGPLFLSIFILLSPLLKQEKLKVLFLSAVGFIIPVGAVNFIIYKLYGYTAFTWLIVNHNAAAGEYYNLSLYLQQGFRTLDMYWFIFFAGAIIIIKKLYEGDLKPVFKNYLIASGASVLLLPIWPYPAERMFYLCAPFLVMVAALGISYFKMTGYFLIAIAAFFNYYLLFHIYKYNTEGLLLKCSLIFCFILLIAFYIERKYESKKIRRSSPDF